MFSVLYRSIGCLAAVLLIAVPYAVDGALRRDESGGAAVADKGIAFDRCARVLRP
jgi:hypothetical protein